MHWEVLSCHSVILFIIQCKEAQSVDEILKCDHCCSNFWDCGRNSMLWPFKWKLLSSTFLWYCLLCCTLYKVVLTFETAGEILCCDHSNETFLGALSHGASFFSAFYKIKFWSFSLILTLAISGSKRVKIIKMSSWCLFVAFCVGVRSPSIYKKLLFRCRSQAHVNIF